MAQDASLIESLRVTLNPSAGLSGDTRFQFGTESKSNYVPFPDAYNYRPLPKVYGQPDMAPEERQHVVFPTVNPRLQAYPDEVKAMLAPVHEKLAASFHRLDVAGTGYLNMEDVRKALNETGVLVTQADLGVLTSLTSRNMKGEVHYGALLDGILDRAPTDLTATAFSYTPGPVPEQFEWSGDEGLPVTLRLHTTYDPFVVPATAMRRYAKELTSMRTRTADPEKLHNLMRQFLLEDLLVSPGRPGQPDLAFRNWLQQSGVLARTITNQPGVIAPEVYEVFNQIIYSLGLAPVTSATMLPTELGASLKRTTAVGPAPP